MFYYADHNIIAQTNGIAEYLKSRMGSRSDKEITVAEKNVSLSFSDDGQIYADTFIDPYHYISVKSVVSEEEMIDFIEALSYEIISLF